MKLTKSQCRALETIVNTHPGWVSRHWQANVGNRWTVHQYRADSTYIADKDMQALVMAGYVELKRFPLFKDGDKDKAYVTIAGCQALKAK